MHSLIFLLRSTAAANGVSARRRPSLTAPQEPFDESCLMLKQRVITALAMLAILLPALFYPSPVPFSAVALVLIAAATWEWGRLNGYSHLGSLLAGFTCVVLSCMSWDLGMLDKPLPLLWRVAGALWVLAGAWLLRGGVAGWSSIPRTLRLVGGVLALWLAWLAVAQARIFGIELPNGRSADPRPFGQGAGRHCARLQSDAARTGCPAHLAVYGTHREGPCLHRDAGRAGGP